MMSVSCFVRMPRVQLSFRFMGPGDSHRTGRLLDRAVRERLSERDVRSRRASACGHSERELELAGGAGNVAHYAGALLTARRQKMAALATLVGGVCGILAILRLFWAPS